MAVRTNEAGVRRAHGARRLAPARSGGLPRGIGERVAQQARTRPWRPVAGAPQVRPLRIYALDPSLSWRLGGVATVAVPWEPLAPGPRGALLELDPAGSPPELGAVAPLDLDRDQLLLADGVAPSPADPRFHLQMAYAVCSLTWEAFRRALGRDIAWAVAPGADGAARLRVRPFGVRQKNAWYDRDEGGLTFGWFHADEAPAGHTVPRGLVCTALSHDIVAHETTHALLDGLRAAFAEPTSGDVPGFHEGFADLVALFQHFSHRAVVEQGLRDARGAMARAALLADLAREFGYATTSRRDAAPLRTAVDVDTMMPFDSDAFLPPGRGPAQYRANLEAHDMGSVLVSAVYEAFATVFQRKSARLFAIAGLDPARAGEVALGDALLAALAAEASDVAARFLDICIRAIDYCPPLDLEIGDYLRALVTADADLVSDDKWGYREALMRSFRRRRLFPPHVPFMSEDALKWRPPARELAIGELAFERLRFDGDPAHPAGVAEMRRQAEAVYRFVTDPRNAPDLFLVAPGAPLPPGLTYANYPSVESVRCARRVAPDGRIVFDLIVEVIQQGTARVGGTAFDFKGGCTLVIDPEGRVRLAICKKFANPERMKAQHGELTGRMKRYWRRERGVWRPAPGVVKRMHGMVGSA